jgi:hypothetical protein
MGIGVILLYAITNCRMSEKRPPRFPEGHGRLPIHADVGIVVKPSQRMIFMRT